MHETHSTELDSIHVQMRWVNTVVCSANIDYVIGPVLNLQITVARYTIDSRIRDVVFEGFAMGFF